MSPSDVRLHPGKHERYRWRYNNNMRNIFISGKRLGSLSANSYIDLRDAIDWGDLWAIAHKCVRFSNLEDTKYYSDPFWRSCPASQKKPGPRNNGPQADTAALRAEISHLRYENRQLKDWLAAEQRKKCQIRQSLWKAEIQLKKTLDFIRYGA